MKNIFTHIKTCITIIHERLLPNCLENNPNIEASTIGAQMNFKAYGKPTKAKIPIVVLLTPRSANHVPKVAEVRSKGRPEKKPTGKNINNLFFKLIFNVSNNILMF